MCEVKMKTFSQPAFELYLATDAPFDVYIAGQQWGDELDLLMLVSSPT